MRKASYVMLFVLLFTFSLMIGGFSEALASAESEAGETGSAQEPLFINPADTIEDQAAALIEYMTPVIPKEIRALPGDKRVVVTADMAQVLIVNSGLNVNLTSNNSEFAVALIENGQAVIQVLKECTAWDAVKAVLTITRKDSKGKVSTLATYSITVIGAVSKATNIEIMPDEGTQILLHSKTSRVAGYIFEKNILDPTVTYQSLNPDIALVDKITGTITPVAIGKFTVKVSGGGISKRVGLEIVKSK